MSERGIRWQTLPNVWNRCRTAAMKIEIKSDKKYLRQTEFKEKNVSAGIIHYNIIITNKV